MEVKDLVLRTPTNERTKGYDGSNRRENSTRRTVDTKGPV